MKQKVTQLLNGVKADIWQRVTSNEFKMLAQEKNTVSKRQTWSIF